MRSSWRRVAITQYGWCPYKKEKFGHRCTYTGRRPCEHEDRGQGDMSISQGTPKTTSKPQKAGSVAWADSPSQPSEGDGPADTPIVGFQSPDGRQYTSVVKALQSVVLCYNNSCDAFYLFAQMLNKTCDLVNSNSAHSQINKTRMFLK